MRVRLSFLLIPLALLLLPGCAGRPVQPAPLPAASATPAQVAPTHLAVMPATYTPSPSPTPLPATPTLVPSRTPTMEANIAATQITPIVQGTSLGADRWSPDSRWLPYVDFNAQALHFYDAVHSTICDFPAPVKDIYPYHFIAWLSDGRAVVQAGSGNMAGLPCGKFAPATAQEALVLDHQDPSFSPDSRYQIILRPYTGSGTGVNTVINLKEVASGKNLIEIAFSQLPRGGGELPGSWLDGNHFLIQSTGDQGPIMLIPGKPPVKIAQDIFHLPLKPGSGGTEAWLARAVVSSNPQRFHIMLIAMSSQAVANPLQIYHSETGQVETLPYLAAQGAFTNDGHWLAVEQFTGQASDGTLLRPLDPPDAPFQPFTNQANMLYTWSPDGSKAYAMSDLAGSQSAILLFSSPKRTLLSAWQATGYELFPFWSPDGKYLAATARSYADPNQIAIFMIRMSGK